MKVIVVSSAPLVIEPGEFSGYGPYVKEMDIWAKYAKLGFVCPVLDSGDGMLLSEIDFPIEKVFRAKGFNVKSMAGILNAIRHSFYNFYLIYKAMRWADHIHLRCPGNISLMGCFVQILFPRKPKTCKYAGNWDPEASQPFSYRLQKWILNNTLLTRNMQVLVYGKWDGASRNIKPFFTASYWESQKQPVAQKSLDGMIRFVFVGTLSEGKRPLYAIKLIEKLDRSGKKVALDFYGEGIQRGILESYIDENNLAGFVTLNGNRSPEEIISAYKKSHFLILPSKSEGWPKVVAEAMFWGCCPVATRVSCVPYMLDEGKRGVLLTLDLDDDAARIGSIIENQPDFNAKAAESMAWSRQFTLDLFDKEIKALLVQ